MASGGADVLYTGPFAADIVAKIRSSVAVNDASPTTPGKPPWPTWRPTRPSGAIRSARPTVATWCAARRLRSAPRPVSRRRLPTTFHALSSNPRGRLLRFGLIDWRLQSRRFRRKQQPDDDRRWRAPGHRRQQQRQRRSVDFGPAVAGAYRVDGCTVERGELDHPGPHRRAPRLAGQHRSASRGRGARRQLRAPRGAGHGCRGTGSSRPTCPA